MFVVDAKLYTGEIHVKDVGGLFSGRDLRLFVGSRDRTDLAVGMAWQVAATVAALGGTEIPVSPVLCFIDAEWPLLGGPREFRGVLIETSDRSNGAWGDRGISTSRRFATRRWSSPRPYRRTAELSARAPARSRLGPPLVR